MWWEKPAANDGCASGKLFPGQYYDEESGLHYNYFRTYDPTIGRYIESDPIGLAAGPNTYAYVGGNPLRRIDPLGLGPGAAIACSVANVGGGLYDFYTSTETLKDSIESMVEQLEIIDNRISECEDDVKEIKLQDIRNDLADKIRAATLGYGAENYSGPGELIQAGLVEGVCIGMWPLPTF
jgi:RHS repeat-associated protein